MSNLACLSHFPPLKTTHSLTVNNPPNSIDHGTYFTVGMLLLEGGVGGYSQKEGVPKPQPLKPKPSAVNQQISGLGVSGSVFARGGGEGGGLGFKGLGVKGFRA